MFTNNDLLSSVPCGTSGVTCSKAITVKVGTGSHQERIKLRKGREVTVAR